MLLLFPHRQSMVSKDFALLVGLSKKFLLNRDITCKCRSWTDLWKLPVSCKVNCKDASSVLNTTRKASRLRFQWLSHNHLHVCDWRAVQNLVWTSPTFDARCQAGRCWLPDLHYGFKPMICQSQSGPSFTTELRKRDFEGLLPHEDAEVSVDLEECSI